MTGFRRPLAKDERRIVDLLIDGKPRTSAEIIEALAAGDYVARRTVSRDVARILPLLRGWGLVRSLVYPGESIERLVSAESVGPVCENCWRTGWGSKTEAPRAIGFPLEACSLCGARTHDGIYAPATEIEEKRSA